MTRVKLDALELLTNEGWRGDQQFLIFMSQCASLIQKVHLKIELEDHRLTHHEQAGALAARPNAVTRHP